jgi:hypothetical protein
MTPSTQPPLQIDRFVTPQTLAAPWQTSELPVGVVSVSSHGSTCRARQSCAPPHPCLVPRLLVFRTRKARARPAQAGDTSGENAGRHVLYRALQDGSCSWASPPREAQRSSSGAGAESEAQRSHRDTGGRATGGRRRSEGDTQAGAGGRHPAGCGRLPFVFPAGGTGRGQAVPGPHRAGAARKRPTARQEQVPGPQERAGGAGEAERRTGRGACGRGSAGQERTHRAGRPCAAMDRKGHAGEVPGATTRQPPWRSGCHVSG